MIRAGWSPCTEVRRGPGRSCSMDNADPARETHHMLRPGDARLRLERTLNAAYGGGLLSHQTLVEGLELLLGSELVEPAGLVGDLTVRRPRRALSAACERVLVA